MYQLAEASPTAPVPPQNLDAEESVLGAMMLSPGAIGAVSEVLTASDFYRASHGSIYKAALDLYAKGEPVDAITLVDELERRGELEEVGGRVRINELAALVPTTSSAGTTLDCPRDGDASRPRSGRAGDRAARAGARRARSGGARRQGESVVFDLSQERVAGEFTHIEDLLKDSFERITALYEAGADVTGIASGYKSSTGSRPVSSPAT
jgi:replicative DNA helicase